MANDNDRKDRRGGLRTPPGGRPKGTTKAAKGQPTAQPFGTRLYPEIIQMIRDLKDKGYAETLAGVVSRAIREAAKRYKIDL